MAFGHKPRVAGTWVDCSNCWSYDTWNDRIVSYVLHLNGLFVETTLCTKQSKPWPTQESAVHQHAFGGIFTEIFVPWHRRSRLDVGFRNLLRLVFAVEVFTASPANLWYRYALPSRPQTVDSAFPKAGYNSGSMWHDIYPKYDLALPTRRNGLLFWVVIPKLHATWAH